MLSEPKLRQEIVNFLCPFQFFDGKESRKAILLSAGLDDLLPTIDLSGNPAEFLTRVVAQLAQYGQVEDEQPALVCFLEAVAQKVGTDRQRPLMEFCDRLRTLAENTRKALVDCPYHGLSAFREKDAQFFFGRERHTEKIIRALEEYPFLAVIGASGSGKSSLIYAGLLPHLRSEGWAICSFCPGESTLQALCAALMPIWQPGLSREDRLVKIRKTADYLRQNELTLPDIWRDLQQTAPELRLLIFIDQFEEVYALCQDAEERQRFLDELLKTFKVSKTSKVPNAHQTFENFKTSKVPNAHQTFEVSKTSKVSVVITLRSDFLGATHSRAELSHLIADHNILVPSMTEEELRQAIAEPANLAGQPLDADTVALLLEQTAGREGALPLLQFALTRIWGGLAQGVTPADTLKQIGGVGGALANAAQNLYDRLSETDKTIARRAFLRMVHLGEGVRDTRRRISLSEIVAQGEDVAHVQAIVRRFADPNARLVTLSATTSGAETAEVTHEALLDHWSTLKEWLDANRDDLRFHRHLAEDVLYWERQNKPEGLLWQTPDLDLLRQYHQRAGQDMTPLQVAFFQASVKKEQHSKRVKRLAVSALTLLTILASVAAGIALWAYKKSEHQARISLVNLIVTSANQHIANGTREQAALLARQAYFLNRDYRCQVNDPITVALRMALLMPEEDIDVLVEQVCQKATRNLALAEWRQATGRDDLPSKPCPGLTAPDEVGFVYRLRSVPMTTEERQALSLNLDMYGYPGTDIENDFEDQGEVIIDHATGLMWQKSGAAEYLTYPDAEAYIAKLNQEQFAGYADWRLPTVEELLSLLESVQQPDGWYINPLFDRNQSWCWSIDKRSSKSTWDVYFNLGFVNWYSIKDLSVVRGVRSWCTP